MNKGLERQKMTFAMVARRIGIGILKYSKKKKENKVGL